MLCNTTNQVLSVQLYFLHFVCDVMYPIPITIYIPIHNRTIFITQYSLDHTTQLQLAWSSTLLKNLLFNGIIRQMILISLPKEKKLYLWKMNFHTTCLMQTWICSSFWICLSSERSVSYPTFIWGGSNQLSFVVGFGLFIAKNLNINVFFLYVCSLCPITYIMYY